MKKLKNFPTVNFISITSAFDRRKILKKSINNLKLKGNSNIFDKYNDKNHVVVGSDSYLLDEIGRGPITSHLKAIKEWYETTDEDYGFFCEDDISFETVKYWNFDWNDFVNLLPDNWECIQLSLTREYNSSLNVQDYIENIKYNMSYFFEYDFHIRHRYWCDWSCVSYLIKRSHAKNLLDNYFYNESFCLEYKGIDRMLREDWAIRPVAETLIYSLFKECSIYIFPLFVENYMFSSTIYNHTEHDCVRSTCSNYILDWWKTKGKNFSMDKMMNKNAFTETKQNSI